MDKSIAKLINQQINKELYSAYLYLSFADYYEEEGLDGYANWYMVQVQEERDHALIFRNYLHSNGEKVELGSIDKPDKEFKSPMDPLMDGLEHERYITSLIDTIYAAAADVKEYRTMQFLDWFIKEQMEEEENAQDLVDKMKLFGNDAKVLYDLDREYAARIYVQASPLTTA